MAGKETKENPKYLLGAVPEVEGVVTFQKNFSVTDKNEQQNLAEEYPELVKELDEQMQRMHHYSPNYPLPGEPQPQE